MRYAILALALMLMPLAARADVEGLSAAPPKIVAAFEPTLLIETDGPPVLAPLEETPEIARVSNASVPLFAADGAFWVRAGGRWLTAPAVAGPWRLLPALPGQLPPRLAEAAGRGLPGEAPGQVHYSDTPAELLAFDGQPELVPIPETTLSLATNVDAAVLRDRTREAWFVLISGRWFRAATLDGPWRFATPDLPADFARLPATPDLARLRAHVPGTPEARALRRLTEREEVVRIARDAPGPEVSYRGAPVFAPVEGTALSYAVNSEAQILAFDQSYYLMHDGAWYVAAAALGPWRVAVELPAEIYRIPPTAPVYNLTYVRLLRREAGAVLFARSAGVRFAYLGWGTVVFGSGWHARRPAGLGLGVFLHRPATYGFQARRAALGVGFGSGRRIFGPRPGVGLRLTPNPATGVVVSGALRRHPAALRQPPGLRTWREGLGPIPHPHRHPVIVPQPQRTPAQAAHDRVRLQVERHRARARILARGGAVGLPPAAVRSRAIGGRYRRP